MLAPGLLPLMSWISVGIVLSAGLLSLSFHGVPGGGEVGAVRGLEQQW